ncbi:MAG: homoaconitase [Phycisphaerales bacterium]|nr:homoaconitase [Phycisphaerales bacterium]
MNGRTAIEKIAARHAVGWTAEQPPRAGDFVTLRPRHVMTHDNTSAVIPKFRSIAGADASVLDPTQPVFAIDHDIQNHSAENLGKYAKIRAFAERQGIRFFPPGRGIAHQVMIEEGFVTPGSLVVGSDSHSNMYGGVAALGTPVVRTDAASLWATGTMWWTIPPQVRVTLKGSLRPGVTGKDVILTLCSHFSNGEVLNTAVEFAGDGIASLTIDDRLTIANMTTEWGALVGFFPFDASLRQWLDARADLFSHTTTPAFTRSDVSRWWNAHHELETDPDATFVREIELDLDTVSPHVCGPNSITRGVPASQLARQEIRIDKAYLMSCVNGRLPDLEAAAAVFAGGRRVAPHVKFYLAAASSDVQRAAEQNGTWQRLIDAGAIVLPSGCGACIGLGAGTLEAGEVGISATNRNFEGRMGSTEAACYLASPRIVAESAVRGFIASSGDGAIAVHATCTERSTTAAAPTPQQIINGFPRQISGRSLVVTADDLNTDGIYGKDVTYRDDLSIEQQAEHAMRNYDPSFRSLVRSGDVVVAGRNFGCGSSREQAATALLGCGIRFIVAASVSQTYQRNAFNNGLVVIECPELVDALRAPLSDSSARTAIGPSLRIDFVTSTIQLADRIFTFAPLNETAQRLIVAGGLESLTRFMLADRAPSNGSLRPTLEAQVASRSDARPLAEGVSA